MISKELMTEILVTIKEVTDIEQFDKKYIKWYGITYEGSYTKEMMNIYEVAHKCKAWADKKGYTIQSWQLGKHQGVCKVLKIIGLDVSVENVIASTSEQDAIFLSCKWILEND